MQHGGCSLRFEAVSKIYQMGRESVRALDGLSLEIAAGEFLSIMGASGCGKSTLLHLAAGLDRATSGDIRIDGKSISDWPDDELTLFRRRRVGFIFQFFNLLPNMTARENAALPLMMDGMSASGWKQEADLWLDRVGLSGRAGHYPSELSGGQMQKVAIVRALIGGPSLILADEPTGNLDSKSGEEIMSIISELAGEVAATVVLVTHDEGVAAFSDRGAVMKDGRIVQ